MEKSSWIVSWKATPVQCHGKASRKAIPVQRHGEAIMECVTETARRAASWKGVTQSDTCGASWNSRHGYCHETQHLCNAMERRHGKRYRWSVTEKPSWNASRKPRGVQRHGEALRKVIRVERHGIVVTEYVTESISDHRM